MGAIDKAQNDFVSEMELSGAEGAGEKSLLNYVGDIVATLFIGILLFPLFIIGMEFSSIMEEGNKNPTPDLSMLNFGGGGDSIDADSLVEIT